MLPTSQIPQSSLIVENTVSPVRPTQGVIDVLSEFVPGQKLLAQVQAQLANGAYRATVGQRDVTLALPFSAKAGDALELEVVQTQGRLAFAVSRNQVGPEGAAQQLSANTTLSRTGQLIARLLSDPGQDSARGTVLNQGKAILEQPGAAGRDNGPALQQAVGKSGLFYESHLAAWIGGRLSEQALRSEPQATLAQALRNNLQNSGASAAQSPDAAAQGAAKGGAQTASPALPSAPPLAPGGPTPLAKPLAGPGLTAGQAGAISAEATAASAANAEASKAGAARAGSALPAEIAPLVQQQLAGLGTNVYAFQALAWAGQRIEWELIDDQLDDEGKDAEDGAHPWKTRLKMLLPSLGDIDAQIQLQGNDVSIRMRSGVDGTRATLHSGMEQLRARMELAGLRLLALDIRPPEPPPTHADAAQAASGPATEGSYASVQAQAEAAQAARAAKP